MNENRVEIVKQYLNVARNSAYLGKYAQAQKTFKQIIDYIEQEIMLNNISRNQIQQWRQFEANIIKQKNAVDNLLGMLSGMNESRMGTVSRMPDQRSIRAGLGNGAGMIGMGMGMMGMGFDIPDTHSPYQSLNMKRRNSELSRAQNQRQLQNLLGKDPDVWDPPPPIEKRKPIKRNTNIPMPRAGGNQSNKKIPSNKKNQGQTNGKKSFLLDRYPDGSGPDTNLIQMLERQVMNTSPNITFDDIAQLQTAKGLLQQAVLLPLKMPQFFTGIRRAWRGVLMFGPPGTGKTLLAKAVASSGGTTFFNVSASSLASKWKGQSQKLVRILFQMAKFYAPSVIFFDQIDALGGRRKDGQDESNRKVKTQLLVQMDGATSSQNQENKFVIVLAATNRPWDLDEALRRRLQKRIYIPLPTEKGRKQLVKINLKNLQLDKDIDMDFVVKKTDGFSGADITNVCRQAAYMPMRKKLKNQGGFKNITDLKKFEEEVNIPLTKDDFLQALKNVNKSVGRDDLKKYELWMKQFGSV